MKKRFTVRCIDMVWSQRNIDRVTKWAGIEYKWNGSFIWRFGRGLKQARDGRRIQFIFFDERGV
jgi:hypothetical protein